MNSKKISIHIGADANLSGVDKAKRSLADLSAAAGKLGSVFGGASSLIGSFFSNILKGSVWQTGASAIGFVYKKVVEHINAAKEAEKQAAKEAKEAADERLKSIADYSAAVDRLAQTRKNTVNQNLKNLNDEIDATKDLTKATLELQRAEARKRGDSAAVRAIEGEMDALDFSAAREKLTNEIAAVGKRRDAERAEVAEREKGLADLTAVIGELTKRQTDLVRTARERATRNATEVAGGSPSVVGGLTYVPASEKTKQRLGDAAEAELRKTDEFRAVAAQIEDARKRAFALYRDPTRAAAAVAEEKSRAYEKATGVKWTQGHFDIRMNFDTFRHELAHILTTPEIERAFAQVFKAVGGKPYFRNHVSAYGGTSKVEAIAESFATVTAHDYAPGSLDSRLEDFVKYKMLKARKDNSNGKS